VKTAEEWAEEWNNGVGQFASDPRVFSDFLARVQQDARDHGVKVEWTHPGRGVPDSELSDLTEP